MCSIQMNTSPQFAPGHYRAGHMQLCNSGKCTSFVCTSSKVLTGTLLRSIRAAPAGHPFSLGTIGAIDTMALKENPAAAQGAAERAGDRNHVSIPLAELQAAAVGGEPFPADIEAIELRVNYPTRSQPNALRYEAHRVLAPMIKRFLEAFSAADRSPRIRSISCFAKPNGVWVVSFNIRAGKGLRRSYSG